MLLDSFWCWLFKKKHLVEQDGHNSSFWLPGTNTRSNTSFLRNEHSFFFQNQIGFFKSIQYFPLFKYSSNFLLYSIVIYMEYSHEYCSISKALLITCCINALNLLVMKLTLLSSSWSDIYDQSYVILKFNIFSILQ